MFMWDNCMLLALVVALAWTLTLGRSWTVLPLLLLVLLMVLLLLTGRARRDRRERRCKGRVVYERLGVVRCRVGVALRLLLPRRSGEILLRMRLVSPGRR